jgi:hypothetical protein
MKMVFREVQKLRNLAYFPGISLYILEENIVAK